MEIHQLNYFVAVAETGGFSRAAERCNVSQPSLSQQIIKLEGELGEKLFDRIGRKVVLTEAGHNLLPRARTILGELQTIQRGLKADIHGAPLIVDLMSSFELGYSGSMYLKYWM